MKRIILFLFILFISVGSAFAENVHFVQVTDVHLNKKNVEALSSFTDEINKYKNLDFVVFTGDNLDKANVDDLKEFLTQVKKIHPKSYVVIGNHDVLKSQDLDKALYMKTVKKYLGAYHSSEPHYVFQCKNIVFIVVDGTKEVIPGPYGYFKGAELEWLEKNLIKYSDKKVVILQHYPLIGGVPDTHQTYKKEEYIDLLERYPNVISVISGHYHINREVMQNGVYHIVTKNFADGKYYKIIDIDTSSGEIFTHLVEK